MRAVTAVLLVAAGCLPGPAGAPVVPDAGVSPDLGVAADETAPDIVTSRPEANDADARFEQDLEITLTEPLGPDAAPYIFQSFDGRRAQTGIRGVVSPDRRRVEFPRGGTAPTTPFLDVSVVVHGLVDASGNVNLRALSWKEPPMRRLGAPLPGVLVDVVATGSTSGVLHLGGTQRTIYRYSGDRSTVMATLPNSAVVALIDDGTYASVGWSGSTLELRLAAGATTVIQAEGPVYEAALAGRGETRVLVYKAGDDIHARRFVGGRAEGAWPLGAGKVPALVATRSGFWLFFSAPGPKLFRLEGDTWLPVAVAGFEPPNAAASLELGTKLYAFGDDVLLQSNGRLFRAGGDTVTQMRARMGWKTGLVSSAGVGPDGLVASVERSEDGASEQLEIGVFDGVSDRVRGVAHYGLTIPRSNATARPQVQDARAFRVGDGFMLMFTRLLTGAVERVVSNRPAPAEKLVLERVDAQRCSFDAPYLSATGCYTTTDPLAPSPELVPYSIRAEGWNDDARARRFISVPPGQKLTVGVDGRLVLPDGTLLLQELWTERGAGVLRPAALRFIVVRAQAPWRYGQYIFDRDGGADAVTLDWRSEIDEHDYCAFFEVDESAQRSRRHLFPRLDGCRDCHQSAALGTDRALGLELEQLDVLERYDGVLRSQLEVWRDSGLLELDALPSSMRGIDPRDRSFSVEARARSYMHTSCAGCHEGGDLNLRAAVATLDTGLCDRLAEGTLGDLYRRTTAWSPPPQPLVTDLTDGDARCLEHYVTRSPRPMPPRTLTPDPLLGELMTELVRLSNCATPHEP